jgi:hypothetical protein
MIEVKKKKYKNKGRGNERKIIKGMKKGKRK